MKNGQKCDCGKNLVPDKDNPRILKCACGCIYRICVVHKCNKCAEKDYEKEHKNAPKLKSETIGSFSPVPENFEETGTEDSKQEQECSKCGLPFDVCVCKQEETKPKKRGRPRKTSEDEEYGTN